MPLRDHFRPPVERRLPWPTLHSGLIGEISRRLNRDMPPGFVALSTYQPGARLEIDVAAVEDGDGWSASAARELGGTAVAVEPRTWTPPAPTVSAPFEYPDTFEVQVWEEDGDGRRLVAAIELVSPSNKDRPAGRLAFASKVLEYLSRGVCAVVIDLVTNRHANLHNEIVRELGHSPEFELPQDQRQYAVTYRPALRGKEPVLDQWHYTFTVGESLPTVPLRLTGDLFVPIDLEVAYTEVCRDFRLLGRDEV